MFFIYATFNTSLALELGLKKLEERGFTGSKLLVVALDPCKTEKQTILDSMYNSDGKSLLDGISIGASVGMVFGVIYGSVVYIGPIALGLIGMLLGGLVGYSLDKLLLRKNSVFSDNPPGDVIIAVQCNNKEEAAEVNKIMKEHRATALGRDFVYI